MAKKLSYYEKFPLPIGFFQCPPLTNDAKLRLQQLADITAVDVVHYAQINDGPLAWHLESDGKDMQVYCADDPDAPEGTRNLALNSVMIGTLDEVAGMFNTDIEDPVEYRQYCKEFHSQALDGVRLYCIENSPLRYVGIHWTVNELPGVLKNKDLCLVKNRDWCFLETHSRFELDDGRRGWVRALTSVEMTVCPDLKDSMGFVRGSYHRAGHVFTESLHRPGYLNVTELLQFDFRGDLTELIHALELKIRSRAHRDLEKHLSSFRLSRITILPEEKLVPRSARSRCNVCSHKFGMLLKKSRCRVCGEVVCTHCSKVWQSKRGVVRICALCSHGLHQYHIANQQDASEWSGSEFNDTASMVSTRSSSALRIHRRSMSICSTSSYPRLMDFDLGMRRKTFYEESFCSEDSFDDDLVSLCSSKHSYYGRTDSSYEPTELSSSVFSDENKNPWICDDKPIRRNDLIPLDMTILTKQTLTPDAMSHSSWDRTTL